MESLESGENNIIEFPETVKNEGPTLLVGLGLQLTADNERLTARTWNIADVLWMKAANDTLDNTAVLLSGGNTGKSLSEGSEADQMFLRISDHIKYQKYGPLEMLDEYLTLFPLEASSIAKYGFHTAMQMQDNSWAVPVYIDESASSTLEDFKYIPESKFNRTEAMISLFAGPARPSGSRARVIAAQLFPKAKFEVFEGDEGKEIERFWRAYNAEGLFAALQETTLAEKGLTYATQFGLGEMLNKITAKRIKKN